MKVIFLNRFFYPDHSATSQLLSDLTFTLAGQGWEVHILTSRQRYDDPDAILPSVEVVQGVRIQRVWTSRFGRGWLPGRVVDYLTFYISTAWRLWRLVHNADVIVAKTDPPLISLVAVVVAKWRGAQLVNWLQDVFPEVAAQLGMRFLRGNLGRLLQKLRNTSLQAAAINVVLGERMAVYLKGQGIPADKITVIHNWADGQAIRPLVPKQNPLRADWGLAGKFVIGYSGNLGRAHEFETILKAAERLLTLSRQGKGNLNEERENSAVVFLFIGGGHQRDWLEQETCRRGLDNIVFKPYQPRERLTQSLGVADVHLVSLQPVLEGYIVPSKFYGIMAAGRPVLFIGDTQGEIATLIARKQCGIAVAEGDSAALAEAIQCLRDDPVLCSELGHNARQALLENFDQRIALKEWTRLLTRVSGGGSVKG